MKKLDLIPCTAPLWARSGHAQTLWAHFLKSPELSDWGSSFEVDLLDGDRLSCFYLPGTSPFVVSLYHGLSGDVRADYMQRTALLCQKLGHTVVLVNHRGAGANAPFAQRPYHSGSAEDISLVLRKLRELFPGKKQIAVGYSMSGNMLLCLLGGYGGTTKPDGAITVNAPINLMGGSLLLKSGLNRLYDARFVMRLRKVVAEKYQKGWIAERYNIPVWSTIWDLDQIYTAPAAGFKDRADYYQSCSSLHYLHKVDRPTYVLTAHDDPFVSAEDYRSASFSKTTQVNIERHGGHLGYLSQQETILGSRRWLDYYLYEALKAMESALL
ncbi:MAG: alpha/beta fold hydrolase [Bdellovibrio sp.]